MKRLINADELKSDILSKMYLAQKEYLHKSHIVHQIDIAPTVDAVEVVHGRWVGSGQWNHKPYRMKNKEKWQIYFCSECGHSNGRRFNDKYCPNCGAKMDGERKDNEGEID